jgi:hypothetical protein
MTVRITNPPAISQFVGLSTDDKPESGVPFGSLFTERNTGSRYVWDGDEWGLVYALPEDVMDPNLIVPRALSAEAVLDEGEADWTSPQDLILVAPGASSPVRDAMLLVDLAKATTGFAAGYSTEELTLAVLRKVDGTNWRQESSVAITGTAAAGRSVRFDLGAVGVDEQIKITAALDGEVDGVNVAEIPVLLYYLAVTTPTLTLAEAGA